MRDIIDYSIKYAVEGFEDYQVKYRRRKIVEIIDKHQPKSILEIGCGMQPLFQFLDESVECAVVEPADNFFQNALRISQNKKNVKCVQGFFEESKTLSELANKYDMIICASLLHELEKPGVIIEAIKSKCHEDTLVHINVPNANSLHRLIAVESGLIENVYNKSERNIKFQQSKVYDMCMLRELAESEGLTVIDSGSLFVKPFTHTQMYEMLQHGLINERILDGLYNVEKYMPGLGSEIYINCKLR